MTFHELQLALEQTPPSFTRFLLPDGSHIPIHAHVTEIGYVSNRFVDCGGVSGRRESALLQTHVGKDTHHRLKSDRFAKILQLGNRLLPNGGVPVEVEYDCCVVSQYSITAVKRSGDNLDLILGRKRTQCLAQERAKQNTTDTCCPASDSCC